MKIGIDIDGVLTDIYKEMLDGASKFCYENNIEHEFEPKEYDDYKMLGLSKENTLKYWNEYLVPYVENCKIRDYANEVIEKLSKKHEIYIITSRDEYGMPDEYYGKMQDLTKEWLQKNNLDCYKLIFTQEKLKACKEYKIDIMIDDSPTKIYEVSKEITTFCYDVPYNSNVAGKNIIRVYSWYDILNKIEKKY